MDYLRSSLKSMVGTSRYDGDPSAGAETIEKLVERLQTSTALEDRRDALRALKSLSKRYRLEVGTQAMGVLMDVLRNDTPSNEITSYAVEALNHVISGDAEEDTEYSEAESQDLGERFTEILIKNKDNVSLILSLIENYDFNVRLPAVRLLTGLLRNRSKDMQDILISQPGSIPKLTDLLQESREVIRNDSVLLLFELIRGNSNIQKTVAFQNAFDRLLDIIYQEGDSIVAEDCLYSVLHLLKNNSSNQQLFREYSLIQKLVPLLRLLTGGPEDEHEDPVPGEVQWTTQRVSNVHLICQVIRSLVSPSNQGNVTASCQKVMNQCGLLRELCEVLMSGGVPADVLTETINTVAEIIRGCLPNQEYFNAVVAPSDPPRPAILVLLMSMVSDKQPFGLRCAVLYCVQCYLYKNEKGKHDIVQTLLPSSADTSGVTTGHLLCTGLISTDPLVVWYSSCTLLHCVLDSPGERERLLRVQLATNLGNPPVSLLQQTASILMQSQEFLTRIGVLMFIASWLANSPVAVAHFLQQPAHVPYLTAQAGATEGDEMESLVQGMCTFVLGICVYFNDDSVEKFNRKALQQILEKRIGAEVFLEKLEALSKSESYARAAQKPQPKAKAPHELVFDFEFTKLFRSLEQEITSLFKVRGVNGDATAPSVSNGPSRMPHTAEQHQEVVEQYKSVIRKQDDEINNLKKQLKATNEKVGNANETETLRRQLEEKCQIVDTQSKQLDEFKQCQPKAVDVNLGAELAQLRSMLEQTQILCQQRTSEAEYYRQQAQMWQSQVVQQTAAQDPSGVVTQLEAQVRDLESQLTYGWQAYERQSEQLSSQVAENARVKLELEQAKDAQWQYWRQIEQLQSDVANLQQYSLQLQQQQPATTADNFDVNEIKRDYDAILTEKAKITKDLVDMKKEHDDLLVLLADQDVKLKEYRRRLKDNGDADVTDDDDDEDEDSGSDVNDGYANNQRKWDPSDLL